ncbi:MAG: RNA polymerase sigma factor FliA [Burkholderiales bacterium]|nr:RNA polymerase sigma factor FliA [Burkholderiales bacterium]
MYNASGQTDIDAQIARYAPLVKRIAHHMMARLPANVQVDDLIQTGMLGLLDAIQRFDAAQGAQFETYASQRIRGAILDGLRANDWIPREVRRNSRKIEEAMNALEQQLGRTASEREVADEMGVPLEEYHRMLLDARGNQLVYYDDFDGDGDEHFLDRNCGDSESGPLEVLLDEDFRRELSMAIDSLPEREKLVMALYYDEELNLKEIGAVLGVGESRVCQLHSQAIARLRGKLKNMR